LPGVVFRCVLVAALQDLLLLLDIPGGSRLYYDSPLYKSDIFFDILGSPRAPATASLLGLNRIDARASSLSDNALWRFAHLVFLVALEFSSAF
jgi:hypothetical protein